MNANTSKLLAAIALLTCVTLLLALGSISAEAGMPILTAITFYVLGNGVTSLRGKTAEPVLRPKDAESTAD